MDKFNEMYNQIISEGLWQNTKNAFRQLTGQGEKDREAAELKRQQELQAKDQEYNQALQAKDQEYQQKYKAKDQEIARLKNTMEATRYNSRLGSNVSTISDIEDLQANEREIEAKSFARWVVQYYPKTAAALFYVDFSMPKIFQDEVMYQLKQKIKAAKEEGQAAQIRKEREMFS